MTDKISIAIDGPASSGKSTVAKLIAEEKDLIYIDTGAMYRALTYQALQKGVDLTSEEALAELLAETDISFSKEKANQVTLLNGEDVSLAIRQNDVTNNVSLVSSYRKVREEMVLRQQKMADQAAVVMDGRDIGTVVLPNAQVKVFLEASVEERARRRFEENKEKGIDSDFQTLFEEIKRRDEFDSNREVSPLKKAEDAIVIDTTALSIEEVKNKIVSLIE